MSGPKVVRIVTREEVIAICEGHLRQLEQAITQWIAQGRNCAEVTEQEIEASRARQRQLAELLKQDAFMELQKKVPNEIAYLKADALRREQLAIEKAAIARKRARQSRENAIALANALEARGIQIPGDLRSGLESIANGNNAGNSEALLARGFALLTPSDSPGLTDAQRNLAAKLAGNEESQTFEAWKAIHKASSPLDALFEHVDSQIAETQVLLGGSHTAAYLARLRTAEAETNDARRKLLLDSLILDLSNGISVAKAKRAASDRLTNLATELQQFQSDEAASLRSQVAACNSATAVDVITALAETCQLFLDREAQRKAAQSRRDVILQGLARLGYEVHEGMSTAWANDGRVVVRKPSLPGYGVEVGGQAESSRLQVRAVTLTNDRDTNRDKDVETIWCEEFSRLQQLVAEHGDDLLIERAMAVGQVPLKVVHHDLEQPLTTAFDRRTLK